ncbi:MAG: hypothetical protein JSU58_07400 [Dehalococcoidales bacterium]|nr:MAG: hypothetical protein JSU58_07400 [Dehalococcoidales bacterium]
MNKDRFLTTRWNNILSLALGLPVLVYVLIVVTSSVMSDFSSYIVLVVWGVVY